MKVFENKDYIIAIAEEGSFSKAAERLYVSQPSLSATVKRLEDKISVPLFDRSTNPVSLTEAGKKYISCALEIRNSEQEFESYISDCARLVSGNVRIGGSSLFSSFMLPEMIARFREQYPLIRFKIFEDSTKNLMQKLSAGTVDIIIDNAAIKNDAVNASLCASEMLLLAVPCAFEINEKLKKFRLTASDIKKTSHFSEKYNVELDLFGKYPFVLLSCENDTGRRANLLFRKHDIEPDVIFTLEQQVTAYNASSTGLGISFVSDTLIRHIDSEPPLYYYRLSDKEIFRSIYFYTKHNRYLSNACRKFIEAFSIAD